MNANEWALLAGTLVPLIVWKLAARFTWTSKAKAWGAALISLVLGAGTVYFTGGLDTAALVTSTLAVYGASQVSYRFIFKPIGWTAPALEDTPTDATSYGVASLEDDAL